MRDSARGRCFQCSNESIEDNLPLACLSLRRKLKLNLLEFVSSDDGEVLFVSLDVGDVLGAHALLLLLVPLPRVAPAAVREDHDLALVVKEVLLLHDRLVQDVVRRLWHRLWGVRRLLRSLLGWRGLDGYLLDVLDVHDGRLSAI